MASALTTQRGEFHRIHRALQRQPQRGIHALSLKLRRVANALLPPAKRRA